MNPQPFSEYGVPEPVLTLANSAIDLALGSGFLPEHFAIDIDHTNGKVRLTFGWTKKGLLDKAVKLVMSHDKNQYTRGGVYSGNRWSTAWSFEAAGSVLAFFLGVHNK